MKKYFPQHKGFVILFTILISTIILMIGLGIFSISTRETVLSSTAREAQYAFYAADAGIECALYAQAIGALTGNGSTATPLSCGSLTTTAIAGTGQFSNPYIFSILVDTDQKSCAKVTVFDINTGADRRMVAQGYNICNDQGEPLTKNPILVERDLDVTYQIGEGGVSSTPNPTLTGIDAPVLPGSIDPNTIFIPQTPTLPIKTLKPGQ